ncbi:ABC transporter, ATP-binding protein (cluster 5, nickel/peptides/opines) / ABC transporter, ATP-binding protein (cluster 5, nickel/peptides/opines) [hydrothermal vent metagenome]|uniref:ABC transporter, ATP-binding protein (Cluster 5, nickel/peptides/opines) / ABC transporter, ATP-binding protein (Cluster 5, nickel/peptides/opines) n=1 Tax=hydrothermal vent metagenome TaxID=652676 RepID=A0A3B0THZ7_9ZZZZ
MTPLLSVDNLSVEFRAPEGTIRAVRGVSFRVPAGKTVALVGESGSGKSVISQAIMRILPKSGTISDGRIFFADPAAKTGAAPVDLARLDDRCDAIRAIRGGRISIIFQEPMTSLSPLHTIGDQIGEAYRLHMGASKAKALTRATEMLDLVGFHDPRRSVSAFPFELSGGLRQRAMIAMALICEPALLIADEPTTALDVTIQAQILSLIADLQKKLHMAVLIITHDLGVVANIADEVVVIYHGEIMETGVKQDIFHSPRHPYLKALLKAVPHIGMKPGERLKAIREIKPVGGSYFDGGGAKTSAKVKASTNGKASASGKMVLEVRNLVKSFGQRRGGLFAGGATERVIAVDDVSFSVLEGECVGLVGESGCGKTTTGKIIMRAMEPDSGQVLFALDGDGKLGNVFDLKDADLLDYRRKVQFMFQDPFSSLNPRMTVYDILTEPLVIHEIGNEAERAKIATELMEIVGLDPRYLRRYPHSFSGGQRQRIGIARALALKPKLLICDEPVSALDVSVQAQVLNLLKDLQAQLGLTMVFISHNLAVIDYMADRILVMCRGRLVESAPGKIFFANPKHPYTNALLAAVPKLDPDAALDFLALREGRASDPALWPAPYGLKAGEPALQVEVEPGHKVLQNRKAAEDGPQNQAI